MSANSTGGTLGLPREMPEDGMVEGTATLHETGNYVRGVRADDGGLDAEGYITVNVSE